MSVRTTEPKLEDRLDQRPTLHPGRLRELKPRALLIRFFAGAATSVAAGGLTLAFGPRTGGIFLAFPAILAASLTLIEEQEDGVDAREDARGAIAGGIAMASFALVGALAFGQLPSAVTLALAATAWSLTALGLYLALWWS